MVRSIFGILTICAALLLSAGVSAADTENSATCPATARLPFVVPAANGPTDATLSATLTSAGEDCSGTFDVVVNGATVGNGTIRLKQEGNELHARVEGTLTSDPFSGTFRGELELQGAGTSARGELNAVFCDSAGQCQEVEARIAATDTGFAIAAKSETEEDETDDD